jgi:uncharacterized membrane protein
MWHYVQNGQACGPVETTTLQELFQKGRIGCATLVWKQGMNDWVPACNVPEFASFAAPGMTPPPVPPLSPSQPPKVPSTSMDPEAYDVEQNKVFAVLAYLGILFLIPLLAAPNSRYARFHTNQGIVLFIASLVLSCAMAAMAVIPFIGFLVILMGFAVPTGILVFIIIGIIHAASGVCKPLPWIGHYQLLH